MQVYNDELRHFGKLGMHWGHHKAVNATTLGAAARTGKEVTALGQTISRNGFNQKHFVTDNWGLFNPPGISPDYEQRSDELDFLEEDEDL